MIKIDVIKNQRFDSVHKYLFELLSKDKYDIKYIDQSYNKLLTLLRDDTDIIWTRSPYIKLPEYSKPFVLTICGLFWWEVKNPVLLNTANKSCQKASRIILLGNYGYNEFLSYMPNAKDKTIVIPNGIHIKDAISVNKVVSVTGETIEFDNDILITFVSNFMFEGKLQAAKELIELFIKKLSLSRVKFVIAGKARSNNPFNIPANLRHKIIYIGYYNNILGLLKRTNIFVYHTYQDIQPNAVLEASAMGIPVVVTNNCGLNQWIRDGITGFVCRNLDELAQKVKLLINRESLRLEMGKEAKKFVQRNFSWQKCAGEYDKVFTELYKKTKTHKN